MFSCAKILWPCFFTFCSSERLILTHFLNFNSGETQLIINIASRHNLGEQVDFSFLISQRLLTKCHMHFYFISWTTTEYAVHAWSGSRVKRPCKVRLSIGAILWAVSLVGIPSGPCDPASLPKAVSED